jgi:lipopolysaccharide/colanic/teichoic acid biosynthesis glycosyltransferase
MQFIRNIFKSGNGKSRPDAGPILSEEEFRAILLHECARCDRNGQRFSLIQVDLEAIGCAGEERRFTRQVIRRVRITDEIGWLSSRTIGIFLPETTRAGAVNFAEEVCGSRGYQIFHYPYSHKEPEKPVKGDNGTRASGNGEREGFFDQSSGMVPDSSIQLMVGMGLPAGNGNGNGRTSSNGNGKASPQSIKEILHPKGLPAWKRVLDIAGASLILLLLSPLFLVVAAFVKLVSPGPVFFIQERVGYLGRSFPMYKFRTMKVSSDQGVHKEHLKKIIQGDGQLQKLETEKDNRLIPMAGLLRKSCIDELPQLINVLKGHMSLVGPRPCLDYEAEEFASWQNCRFDSVPGMTGLWQVSGKNRTTFTEMMRLDVSYCRKRTLRSDLGIFFSTPHAILKEVVEAVAARRTASAGSGTLRPAGRIVRNFDNLVRQLFL